MKGSKIFAGVLGLCGIVSLPAVLGKEPGGDIAYPAGYREWVHVKTTIVGPQNPMLQRYAGIHHIYANKTAMDGYGAGRFADGSVLVFDLLETRDNAGITTEGPRRFIDVMKRDSRLYPATGGWGFEEFSGDGQTGTLTAEARADCYNCHATQKGRDFVFSSFRK